jgi:phosphatidylserine synthase 2
LFLSFLGPCGRNCKRIGPQAWLLIANIATEVLIVFKFGQDEFPNPATANVIYFWIVFATVLTLYPIYQFYLRPKMETKTQQEKVKEQ